MRPEDKGLQKLFILFFVVFKPYGKMPLKHRQAIASTAQTYVKAMWGMWCMVALLHQMCKGTEHEWRNATTMRRALASRLNGHFPQPLFNTLARSAQNLCEFLPITLLMIMLSLSKLPSDGAIVNWISDNTSALSWANSHRCSSEEYHTQLAFIALSLCEQVTHIKLHDTIQLKSEEMGIVDQVSRTNVDEGLDVPRELKREIESFPGLLDLLELCNPYNKIEDVANDHHDAYIRVARIMATVKKGIPEGKHPCSSSHC
jgi:hypothetical protein